MDNIEKFELLGEEFAQIERDINAKKVLNEKNILQYGNMVLEKAMLQIQKEIESIDSVFPLECVGNLIKYKGMNAEFRYSRGKILIELDFKTKKIGFKHQSNLNGYIYFYPHVAIPEERKVSSISPERYIEIFGTENPEYILTKSFQILVNRILDFLETKLKNLKEKNEKMPILDFPFLEKIEEKQDRIKIGEFQGYSVILEKEGE